MTQKLYILTYLDLCAVNKIQVQRVPLIKDILGGLGETVEYDFGTGKKHATCPASKSKAKRKSVHQTNAASQVVRQLSAVTFTPIVDRIGRDLFKGYEVVGTSDFHDKDDDIAAQIDDIQGHRYDPENMVWGRKISSNRYRSITMDGVKYRVSLF